MVVMCPDEKIAWLSATWDVRVIHFWSIIQIQSHLVGLSGKPPTGGGLAVWVLLPFSPSLIFPA